MKVDIKFTAEDKQLELFEATKRAQMWLDNRVMKDSNYYAPMKTGTLMKSVITGTVTGSGLVVWAVPYARRMYYDATPKLTQNPNARNRWFEAAKALKLKEWREGVNAFYL